MEQDFRILLASLHHTTIYQLDPARGELHWELDLDAPHDIAGSRGTWQLASADGGRATLVRYSAAVESGRQVPGFVERLLVERSIDALFESLRGELARRHPDRTHYHRAAQKLNLCSNELLRIVRFRLECDIRGTIMYLNPSNCLVSRFERQVRHQARDRS